MPVTIAHSHSKSQDKDIKYPIKLLAKRFIPKYANYLFSCGKEAGDWMFSGKNIDKSGTYVGVPAKLKK